MSAVIFALVLAGLITGATITVRRRPVYRAAARGAWKAGARQTRQEFRAGYARTRTVYDRAQKKLRKRGTRRARVLSFVLETLGVTLVTAGGAVYGAAVTIGAAGRVAREATRGARREYQSYRDAVEVEAVEVTPASPEKPAPADPAPGQPETPAQPQASEQAEPEQDPAAPQPPSTTPDPGATPDTTTEGSTTMAQSEASGLTSYSQAHADMAAELQDLINSSQSLAGSMSDVLADHSDLIGDTATLQDLLVQAQNVAQQLADRAAAVASS
ncbi:hypothetical protein AB0K21_22230 [Streptosporangium sp. NPDC049248]|uniref:hypothetical protein n=1 Tax=Streptosporangium sp. NPDC049248 TaxID=3155651 RepID=UPI0034417768